MALPSLVGPFGVFPWIHMQDSKLYRVVSKILLIKHMYILTVFTWVFDDVKYWDLHKIAYGRFLNTAIKWASNIWDWRIAIFQVLKLRSNEIFITQIYYAFLLPPWNGSLLQKVHTCSAHYVQLHLNMSMEHIDL